MGTGSLWKGFSGEQEGTEVNVEEDMFEGSFQATLDSFRAQELFEEAVGNVEEQIEELEKDAEISTAIRYGSDVAGLAIYPDAVRNKGLEGSERYDASDLDLMLVLEGEDAESVRNQVADLAENSVVSEPGNIRVDAKVCTRESFLDQMEEAMGETENPGELAVYGMFIGNTVDNVQASYPSTLRGFATGFVSHNDYRDPEILGELTAALQRIQENGEFIEDLPEDFSENGRDYSERIRTLRENHQLGIFYWNLNNSQDSRIPRKYEIDEETGYAVDRMNPRSMELEELVSVVGEECFSSVEKDGTHQAELSSYRDA